VAEAVTEAVTETDIFGFLVIIIIDNRNIDYKIQ